MLDLEELLTLDEAVEYLARCGVHIEKPTLSVWIHRKHLDVAERDRRGRAKRVTVLALARAEHATRKHARRVLATAA